MDDLISRAAAIKAIENCTGIYVNNLPTMINKTDAYKVLTDLPSAQPRIEESLYRYKCFITDAEGLQHEVIHVGDIRRVTGWEI